MKQINLLYVQKNWKNIALAIAVIIIFLMVTCQNSKEPSPHKAKAETYLTDARKEVSGTDVTVSNYKKIIAEKDAKIKTFETLLANSQRNTNDKLNDLKHYKNSDIAIYFKDRFNVTEGLKSIDSTTIAIKDTVSRLVIGDLIRYDGLKYDTPILKSQLNAVNEKFIAANKTVDTLKISISNIASHYEKANNEKDLAIKYIEKQVRSERRKKNFWKYATVVVASGLGYLYITK